MERLIGRAYEKGLLYKALQSSEAELIAIYGRRRVGKTFLIRSVFAREMVFEFSGAHNASIRQQLQSFSQALRQASDNPFPLAVPKNWMEAFYFLQQYLKTRLGSKKSVIFFDEFPWIDTRRSGFLAAFENFWNTWASKQDNLLVVICGSAASWMIQNIVNNKGGLHNRISQRIRLLPFDLAETEAYLNSRAVVLDRYQILQIYMAMGGIPQYLKSVEPGESAAHAIDRTCFSKDGRLQTEFKNLYQSLFDNAGDHIAIVKALAAKGKGLNRNEILEACGLKSGGGATKLLNELEESGFIRSYIPFGKTGKDNLYRLADEYSLFYLKFIEHNRSLGTGTWQKLSATTSWRSWSGIAFEGICLKHIAQIKKGLGIEAVQTTESVWRYVPGKGQQGAQIDLLIDRDDHCINICEMKYSGSEFTIDKSYASDLKRKLDVFKEITKTRKSLFLTMITTYGVRNNAYHAGLVQKELTMDTLFE